MKTKVISYILILGSGALLIAAYLVQASYQNRTTTKPSRFIDRNIFSNNSGIVIGEKAKPDIIEFYDYECPYCKDFNDTVNEIL